MIMVIAHERARGRQGPALGCILISITMLVSPVRADAGDSPQPTSDGFFHYPPGTRVDTYTPSGGRTGIISAPSGRGRGR